MFEEIHCVKCFLTINMLTPLCVRLYLLLLDPEIGFSFHWASALYQVQKWKKKKLFSLRCTKCTVTISDRILNYTIPVLWGLASRETVMLHLWEYNHSLWWKANARNVSFIISFRWLIHVINSVDQTRLSCNTCFMSMTKVIFPFFWSCFFSTCRYNWVGKSVFEMPGTGKCQRQWS